MEPASPEDPILAAARALSSADFLLVAAGAGFSAESGLPVYKDIAKNPAYESRGLDYGDVCRIGWLRREPELFYGFWGSCLNAYRDARPHRGYELVKAWCDRAKARRPGCFRVYTSNVDGMFERAGFERSEVVEVHGSLERWLESGGPTPPSFLSPPPGFRFKVEERSMLAARDPTGGEGKEEGELFENPCNQHISTSDGKLCRPAVLMFGEDQDAYEQLGLRAAAEAYQEWEEEMEREVAASPGRLRLVVLELGCGLRVPSVRQECEDVVKDTNNRVAWALVEASRDGTAAAAPHDLPVAVHIRINPEEESWLLPAGQAGSRIYVRQGALAALEAIDEQLRALRGDE